MPDYAKQKWRDDSEHHVLINTKKFKLKEVREKLREETFRYELQTSEMNELQTTIDEGTVRLELLSRQLDRTQQDLNRDKEQYEIIKSEVRDKEDACTKRQEALGHKQRGLDALRASEEKILADIEELENGEREL